MARAILHIALPLDNQIPREIEIHVRAGHVVLAHVRGLVDPESVPATVNPKILADSKQESESTGKPVLLCLAERSVVPIAELTDHLHVASMTSLAKRLPHFANHRFFFRGTPLPAYSETYGKNIDLTQVALVASRNVPLKDEAPLKDLLKETVVQSGGERAAGRAVFDHKLELNADERHVLFALDGKTPESVLANRAGISLSQTRAILDRLRKVGVVRSNPIEDVGPRRPIAVAEPDREGFVQPLARLLQKHGGTRMVDVTDGLSLIEALQRIRPQMLLLNVDTCQSYLKLHGGSLRAEATLENVQIVGVIEPSAAQDSSDLRSQNLFDAILTKPVSFGEIQRLLRGETGLAAAS